MIKAAEYRAIAAKFRREAMETSLPQKRLRALNAAQRWDELAQEIEVTVAPGAVLGGRRATWFS